MIIIIMIIIASVYNYYSVVHFSKKNIICMTVNNYYVVYFLKH